MADDDVKAAIEEATAGLLKKNKELMKELKTAQSQLSKFVDVDVDSLLSAKAELEDLKQKKLEADGEYKKMYEAQKESHAKEVAKFKAENAELKTSLVDVKKVNALSNALADSNAIPELIPVAVTTLKDKVAVDDNDNLLVGDKPVADFVKEWAASPVGKHFVKSGNSGGGAEGGAQDKTDAAAKFFDKSSKDYNLTEQAKINRVDPARYERLKALHS